jgi:UDP-glucose 4-epimerase
VNPSARTIAVTGAGGFLGRYFCTRLRERGYAVRALTTRPLQARDGVTVVRIEDRYENDTVERALRGADVVVHLAGAAHIFDDRVALDSLRRVNVTMVDVVCAAAARAGASCVALMSSAAVVGDPGAEVVTTGTPARPTSAYGQSKLDGEARAYDRLAGTEVRLRVIRPPMVYGPGMRGNPLRLFALVDRGIPLPLGGLHNRRSMVSARNLLDAVETTVGSPAPTGVPLYVSDASAPSTRDFVRAIGVALDRPARLIPIPHGLLSGLAAGIDVAGAMLPRVLRARADDLRRLTGTFVVDDSAIRDGFGYVARQSLTEGLSEAAAWWRAGRPDVWS